MARGYLAWRLLLAVPTLFGVIVVVFVLLRVVPGDPMAMMMPAGSTAADVEKLRVAYGLDQPMLNQFVSWFFGILHGDFGTSISLRENVLKAIFKAVPATLELAAIAFTLACAIAFCSSLVGSYWRGRWPEVVVDAIAGLTQAIPDFMWGLLFILIVATVWPVLPITGRVDPQMQMNFSTPFYLAESILRGRFDVFLDVMEHMLLPALALALPFSAMLTRLLKSSLIDAMAQDYVLVAQVRGFSRWTVLVREALRNALVPVVTLSGVQLTFLVGGTVLIERIFGYPGIGNLSLGAVLDRDLPLIQGVILTFAVIFMAITLLVDIATLLINPRLRNG
jgi:peptide/nickel transport system permease protein